MTEVTVHYDGSIVSRKEAQALGLARYFSGSKCKNNHVSQRNTVNGSCVQCSKLYKPKPKKTPLHYIYLGLFKTRIEAAKAYQLASQKYFGEFAYLDPRLS